MKTRLQRRADFMIRWEKQRKNKIKYAFIHGCLIWALPEALWIYFDSEPKDMAWKILLKIVLYMIPGYFMGLWFYNQTESRYQQYLIEDKREAED